MTDALGQTTRYEYDAGGNLSQETDPLGHETSYPGYFILRLAGELIGR
jgi:YD repeat-containing protein